MDTLKNFEGVKALAAFIWPEADLPARLGITAIELMHLRREQLDEGIDWRRKKRAIHLTTEAVKTIAAVLSLAPRELSWLEPVPDAPEPPKPPERPVTLLRVYGRPTQNPVILLCVDADKRLVRVRVKNKVNFRPGMEVRAEHAGGDLYLLIGNCPRFPGKY